MRKKYSAVWLHFEPEEDDNRARCKICNVLISYLGGSQGNLNRHIKAKHPKVILSMDEVTQATKNLVERELNDDQTSPSTERTKVVETTVPTFDGDPLETENSATTEIYEPYKENSGKIKLPFLNSKRRSAVWLHFDDVGGNRAKCKFCKRLISFLGGSQSNLSRHMKLKHPSLLTLNEVAQSTKFLMKQEVNDSQPSTSNKKRKVKKVVPENAVEDVYEDALETMSTIENSTETQICEPSAKKAKVKTNEQINRQLLRMIIKGQHSFRLVEEPAFKELVHEASKCPGYGLPTRKRLTNVLLPKVQKELLDGVRKQIRHATDVCLAFDKWSSRTKSSYAALTAHYINPDTELKSHLLACQELEDGHNAQSFYKFLKNVITEFDINNKITVIVSDNTPEIAEAISEGGWLGIACFAHSLNSTVQNALQSIAETIDNVRKIAEFSSSNLQELNEFINLPPISLIQDDPNMWTTTYEMLQNINQIRDGIILTISSKHPEYILSSKDWEIIAETLPILKPFYEVVKDISSEKNLCLSKVTVLCNILETYVSQNFPMNIEVGGMLSNLQLGLFSCFGSLEKEYLHAESAILDPRFKRRGFRDEDSYKEAVNNLSSKINSDSQPNDAEQFVYKSHNNSIDVKTESLWSDYDTEFNKTVKFNSEFEKYLNEEYLDRKMDPFVWWKQRKCIYPHVYSYAVKRLCIVATAVPCERIFSATGQILTEKRTHLKPKTVEGLVFLHHNM